MLWYQSVTPRQRRKREARRSWITVIVYIERHLNEIKPRFQIVYKIQIPKLFQKKALKSFTIDEFYGYGL